MLYKPNVFVDFHHAGLLQSLIFLFEKRMGGKVYRPIGTKWFEEGFWKVYDHPATVEQFLGIGGATPDGSAKLNEVDGMAWLPNEYPGDPYVYFCRDIDSGKFNNAITFEGFMKAPIDIVIASLPAHIEPFKRLCELHPNKPKLIFQIGNAWTVEAGMAPNVMASAIINDVPPDVHFISYHQEFDTSVFYPSWPFDFKEATPEEKQIGSFVNCFDSLDHFQADWQLFQQVERMMPDWRFCVHGGQCRDGAIGPASNLATVMLSCRFIWHTKNGGDGYGHVLHNAAAVGRPIITKKLYYAGKMGEKLMIDGKTCIAIDGLGPQEIMNKIEFHNNPVVYQGMCAQVSENFKKVVNFDKEFEDLQIFLNNLL